MKYTTQLMSCVVKSSSSKIILFEVNNLTLKSKSLDKEDMALRHKTWFNFYY